MALRPDLVLWLTDGGAMPAVSKIAELGIPVLAIPVIGIDDVLHSCRAVGLALGDAPAGERLASSLEASIARIRARAASLPTRRVLFIVGREPLVVAGPGSYPDQLLRVVGARNVVEGTVAWPVFPVERAAALDPDVVVDAAVNEHGTEAGDRGLSAIPAVRRGAVPPADHRRRAPARAAAGARPGYAPGQAIHPEASRR